MIPRHRSGVTPIGAVAFVKARIGAKRQQRSADLEPEDIGLARVVGALAEPAELGLRIAATRIDLRDLVGIVGIGGEQFVRALSMRRDGPRRTRSIPSPIIRIIGSGSCAIYMPLAASSSCRSSSAGAECGVVFWLARSRRLPRYHVLGFGKLAADPQRRGESAEASGAQRIQARGALIVFECAVDLPNPWQDGRSDSGSGRPRHRVYAHASVRHRPWRSSSRDIPRRRPCRVRVGIEQMSQQPAFGRGTRALVAVIRGCPAAGRLHGVGSGGRGQAGASGPVSACW